jgi:hypothetical protein
MAFGANRAARIAARAIGEMTFLGSECARGHRLRYTSTAQCVACISARAPRANPDAPRRPAAFRIGIMSSVYAESPMGRERATYLDNVVRKHLGLKPKRTASAYQPPNAPPPPNPPRQYLNGGWESRLVQKSGLVKPVRPYERKFP